MIFFIFCLPFPNITSKGSCVNIFILTEKPRPYSASLLAVALKTQAINTGAGNTCSHSSRDIEARNIHARNNQDIESCNKGIHSSLYRMMREHQQVLLWDTCLRNIDCQKIQNTKTRNRSHNNHSRQEGQLHTLSTHLAQGQSQ